MPSNECEGSAAAGGGIRGALLAGVVRRFDDLIAWQKAMDLAVAVYESTGTGPISRDFALRDQIHRAAISVPSNISEGFERGSRTEFHRFVTIAKASCAELRTQIELARRVGYFGDTIADRLTEKAEEVARIVGALRVSLARPRTA